MNDLVKTEELDVPVKPNLAPVEDAVFTLDPQNPNKALTDIDNAIVVPLQANMEMWNPVSEGDTMVGLLNGFTVLQMQSMSNPETTEDTFCRYVRCWCFYVLYRSCPKNWCFYC